MNKTIVLVIGLLLLFGVAGAKTKIIPLEGIQKPNGTIEFDKERMYLIEDTTVYIYSLKDFKLLTKFGRKGEGPQEFMLNPQVAGLIIYVYDKDVVVNSFGKLSWWTKQGQFIREQKLKYPLVVGLQPFGEKYYMGTKMIRGDVLYRAMVIFDDKMEEIKELARVEHDFQRGKGIKMFNARPSHYIRDNVLYLAWKNEISIRVFDTNLKETHTITYDNPRQKMPESMKQETIHYMKNNVPYKDVWDRIQPVQLPDYLPAIQEMYVTGGKVYIATYKLIDDRKKTELLIFDLKGTLLKRTQAPILMEDVLSPFPHNINDGKIYQLVEDADKEVWNLHIIDID